MRRSFLLPLSVALAGLFGKSAVAQPAPVTTEPRREPNPTSQLTKSLLALPTRAGERRPLVHVSHASHASHVSHASHSSHFSSSTPPPVTPPPAAAPPGGVGGTTTTKGYALDLDLNAAIEKSGVTYEGSHVAIASALCAGEAQYGSKWVGYELEYHRFSCDLYDSAYNMYQAEVVITKSNAKYFWWQVVSIKQL